MRDLIRLTDLDAGEIFDIFGIADELCLGKYGGI